METKTKIVSTKLEGQPTSMIWCYGTKRSNMVVVADWDRGLNCYKLKKELTKVESKRFEFISLDLYQYEQNIYLACSDTYIRKLDLEKLTPLSIGSPGCTSFKVFVSDHAGKSSALVYSVAWDKTLAVWDERTNKPASIYKKFAGKPYAAACEGDLLAIATNAMDISLFNLPDFQKKALPTSTDPLDTKELPRSLAIAQNYEYIAVGTYGAEVLAWWSQEQDQQKMQNANIIGNGKYTEISRNEDHFKAGRTARSLYPVNDVKFHPRIQGVLGSGGGDGQVLVYDCFGEIEYKKVNFENKLTIPVAQIEFHKASELIAISVGEDFDNAQAKNPTLTLMDFREYLPEEY